MKTSVDFLKSQEEEWLNDRELILKTVPEAVDMAQRITWANEAFPKLHKIREMLTRAAIVRDPYKLIEDALDELESASNILVNELADQDSYSLRLAKRIAKRDETSCHYDYSLLIKRIHDTQGEQIKPEQFLVYDCGLRTAHAIAILDGRESFTEAEIGSVSEVLGIPSGEKSKYFLSLA